MAEVKFGFVGALSYLITRFITRLIGFLYDWYVGGFKIFVHTVFNIFESLDRVFALKITLRYMFRPLYQDRSAVGYILGFLFRLARALAGALFYAALWIIFAGVYAVWAATPLLLVYFATKTYGSRGAGLR
jgi:hypothetical protein